MSITAHVREKADLIWAIADKLTGPYKPHEYGKVQLINANGIFTKMRKSLGNKRVEITQDQVDKITRIYGDFTENDLCKILNNEDCGYRKITVERPLRDDNGETILKSGRIQPDPALRDTENVPLNEDVEEYFKREVLPFAPDAWIDEKKTKIGYEIPFTRYFYKYDPPRSTSLIAAEINQLARELSGGIEEILGE